jgi:hypothetical protein
MNSHHKIIFFIFLLIASIDGYGQIFGGNPASLRWNQINTPLSRVIFPKGLDSTGQRVTNIINFISTPTRKTIGPKIRKINLVIQNQTTISNAYVGLGPFRSEFLITPMQNSFELGSLPWPDQLTIHEYRHVEQYNNFNVGVSKVLHGIFGDEGQALANDAAIPNWFFEGDAVFNETYVSNQGRGRLPFFFDPYRALWQDGKKYSWMKLRNGSLKDFVPNHYYLGYMMVSYGREKYGDNFWKNVTHDAAAFKGLFYPLQKAIKRYSGVDYVTFRNNALDFFKSRLDSSQKNTSKFSRHTPYRDEQFPVFTKTGSIIYAASSYQQIPEFVIKRGNIIHRIRISDYAIDNQFSYRNGLLVYASYQPDLRWGYRDYCDLKVINANTGKQYTLTKRTKYFSPDISPDGKTVVAVDESPDTKCLLHILDAHSGKILRIIPNPDHLFYTYPKFFSKTQIISAVRNPKGEMSLALITIADGKAEYLTPFTYSVLGYPFVKKDTVYFSFAYHMNDELFAYTFPDKKIWLISTGQQNGVGKYQPAVNDSLILWSSFTASGYRLRYIPKKQAKFIEVASESMDSSISDFGVTALQHAGKDLLQKVPDDTFKVRKYDKGFKLINIHSIQPSADDPDYSLSLLSENILNTFQSQLGFTYDRAERFKRFGLGGTYGAFFPFLTAGVNYTLDRKIFYHGNTASFDELEPYGGFSIPLNFSKGRSFTYLTMGSQYVFNETNFQGRYKDTLGNISYSYSSNYLSFSHQNQTAVQQIFPRFAQTLDITYATPVTKYRGYQFMINGNIYLPGLFKTHSLSFNLAYLSKDTLGQINFASGFPFSRGYAAVNLHQMFKWGINYQFPVLYPDAGFGDMIYLLRVRSNLYYDYTNVYDFNADLSKFTADFKSLGMEVYFDTKWWNQAAISFGIRYSYLLDEDLFGGFGHNRWEIILPVNIFNQ